VISNCDGAALKIRNIHFSFIVSRPEIKHVMEIVEQVYSFVNHTTDDNEFSTRYIIQYKTGFVNIPKHVCLHLQLKLSAMLTALIAMKIVRRFLNILIDFTAIQIQ
jgi:hypothetical protein